MERAVKWLMHSQDKMPDNGFGSYHLINKWTSSYVETTGYIIPSLIEYGIYKNNDHVIKRAINAADWLLEIQKKSGGWQGECIDDNRPEVVFNTGQVIRGLHAVYNYTKDTRYLNAAIKACDWLCEVQEVEGYWKKFAFLNTPRVYDSYVDAPLLMMFKITGKDLYKEKAVKNLNWITENKQYKNGWFEDCDNTIKRNDKPILHTIAYTVEGLLESGILLNDTKFIDAARKSSDKLLEFFTVNNYLNGRYDADWTGSEYLITTGCAQIAIVWMKFFRITGELRYLQSAIRMNDLLIFIQNRNTPEKADTEGALPGSYPLWGKYEPFCFPNWATKFFLDSLLLESECLKELDEKQLDLPDKQYTGL